MVILKKKTIGSAAGAILIAVSGLAGTAEANFSEFSSYADTLASKGVIGLKANASDYRVFDNLTRGESAAMIVRHTNGEDLTADGTFFKDMPKSGNFTKYVEALASEGKISTERQYFNPNWNITRSEFLKMSLNGFLGTDWSPVSLDIPFKDVSEDWQKSAVAKAYETGLISSSEKFRPNDTITRGEAFKILSNLIEFSTDEGSDDISDIFDGDNGTSSGSNDYQSGASVNTGTLSELNVSLSTSTPVGSVIPSSAQGVILGKFDMTASKDVSVDRFKFQKTGLSNNNVLSGIAVYVNGIRTSAIRTISSDGSADITINPSINVKTGQTVSIELVGNVNTSTYAANSEFAFVLSELGAGATSKTVSLSTSKFSVSPVEVGSVTISNNGQSSSVKVGETAKDLYKFKLQNPTTSTNLAVKSITLKQIGTLATENDLENVSLYSETGELLSKASKPTSDFIKFDFINGLELGGLKSLKFIVKADILGGAGRTVRFELNNVMDLNVINKTYGFGVKPTSTVVGDAITVGAGSLVLGGVDTGIQKITKAKTDVSLIKFKLTANAGKALSMEKFYVYVENTGTGRSINDFLENVRLYDETSGYGYDLSYKSAGTGSGYYYDNGLDHSIKDGSSHVFSLRVNVKNLAGVDLNDFINSKFSFKINTSGTDSLKITEYESNSTVTDITPSVLTFNTIEGSSSAVSLNTLPLSNAKNAVIGAKNVPAIEFEIKNNDVNDVTVNSITLDGSYGSGGLGGSIVSELRIYKDSVSDSNLIKYVSGNSAFGNKASFDGLNFKIGKNLKRKFVVTISTVDDVTNVGKEMKLALSSIDMTDSEGDDVYLEGTTTALTSSNYVSDRKITLVNGGTLATVVNNTSNETLRNKTFVANSTSPYVAAFEIIATGEPIKIKELDLVAEEDVAGDFKKSIAEAILFNKDKTELARTSVTSSTITFTNLNITVAEGSENIYVKLVSRKIGKDEAGAKSGNIRLKLAIKKADGSDSLKQLTVPGVTTASNSFAVYPVRINNVEFVNTYGGAAVSTKLVNGDNNVAIIKISPDAWTNTNTSNGANLKMLMSQIKTYVSKFSGTTVNSFKIEKIGGTDSAVSGTVSGNYVTFDMSGLTTDRKIESGAVTYYVVKANVTKDGTQTTDDYLKIEFDGFNNSELSYKSDESGDTDLTKLGIDISKLDGIQINE